MIADNTMRCRGAAVHVALAAKLRGVSLNGFIGNALDNATKGVRV